MSRFERIAQLEVVLALRDQRRRRLNRMVAVMSTLLVIGATCTIMLAR